MGGVATSMGGVAASKDRVLQMWVGYIVGVGMVLCVVLVTLEHYLVPPGCVCHDCTALLTSSCGNCRYVVSADLHRPNKAF